MPETTTSRELTGPARRVQRLEAERDIENLMARRAYRHSAGVTGHTDSSADPSSTR